MPRQPGQRDYSQVRLTHHALERFLERFWQGGPGTREEAETALRKCLARSHRLGRNPQNSAIAVLAAYEDRMLVAILQGDSCLTVLTWALFEPRMPEFGRSRLPRKRGRLMRRLQASDDSPPGPDP